MPHCNDMEIELSYISIERSRHGKKTLYVRYRGHRIRLREIPGTPEFLDEYRKALASAGYMSGVSVQQAAPNKVPALKRDYPRGSFGWLVLKYFSESPALRSPCGEQWAIPASVARSLNQFPKAAPDAKARPWAL